MSDETESILICPKCGSARKCTKGDLGWAYCWEEGCLYGGAISEFEIEDDEK